MSETTPPRRPILHLKLGTVVRPLGPEPLRPLRAAPPPAPGWKCKPCGSAFAVPADLPDDEAMRCPKCNANLGLASAFRADPPLLEKVRARPFERKAASPLIGRGR